VRIASLIASRNRPDLVQSLVEQLRASTSLPHDVYVVECGSDPDKLSPHSTLWYADPDFPRQVLRPQPGAAGGQAGRPLRLLLRVDERRGVRARRRSDPHARGADGTRAAHGILSPANVEGGYPGAARERKHGWRAVTTCDYLGFLMRASALDEVGFLSPDFKYCWGAIHELAYKLYASGWFVAYSDEVVYRHLGGSTYGHKDTRTISRDEYQQRAKRFAFDYFRRTYGDNWEELFWTATRGHDIAIDTFAEHKTLWASAYTPEELREFGFVPGQSAAPLEERMRPPAHPDAVRLHLGCGTDKRAGWINVDSNAEVRPDIVANVGHLPMFQDRSVDVIEACHLFEHLTYDDARSALEEWARILRPSGELFLELPDLEACIRILGRYRDEHGIDLGLIGMYGWPPDIATGGVPQIHKWGWTRVSLSQALLDAGFERTEFGPIMQTWRVAAKVGRDVRLRAVRGRSSRTEAQPSVPTRTWNLRTTAKLRVFAWPNWNDASELAFLLNAFGRHLVGRSDVCLCLRRDPSCDPSEEQAVAALQAAHARVLGTQSPIECLLVDDELPGLESALECEITVAIALPSSRSGARAACMSAFGAKLVHSIDPFVAALSTVAVEEAPNYPKEVLDTVDWALVEKIKALHPWFYPVTLGNLQVAPGVGSPNSPAFLTNRIACRTTLLVDEVARRFDLRGKSILELACNCGYWSARYAERGAARVVGIEGREQYVRQAELYWSANRFLPADRVTFLHGNIASASDWPRSASSARSISPCVRASSITCSTTARSSAGPLNARAKPWWSTRVSTTPTRLRSRSPANCTSMRFPRRASRSSPIAASCSLQCESWASRPKCSRSVSRLGSASTTSTTMPPRVASRSSRRVHRSQREATRAGRPRAAPLADQTRTLVCARHVSSSLAEDALGTCKADIQRARTTSPSQSDKAQSTASPSLRKAGAGIGSFSTITSIAGWCGNSRS
jgi:SAM-dependent methyltransferase